MARIDFDTIGDFQKSLEAREAGRAIMPGLPVLARLDGVGFHNFTKGLKRPYDTSLTQCMHLTAVHLLDKLQADIVYTQSDEITLGWKNEEDMETKLVFSGKYQKLCSTMAARASVHFNMCLQTYLPEKAYDAPVFDCRVWQVPNLDVAAQNFLWRELDATKNSITMAASAYYTHHELHKVPGWAKKDMLLEKGVNWNDYPDFFKKGAYFHKRKVQKELSAEELQNIPEAHRPKGPVIRSIIVERFMPKATSLSNYDKVLFWGEEPIVETQENVNENSQRQSPTD